jgi:hypothetical protein
MTSLSWLSGQGVFTRQVRWRVRHALADLRRHRLALREPTLVNHGALSQSRVYELLCSKDERVRRAAFILLETSNPTLRRNSEVFLEIIRFIWNANPNYDVYREFSKRHLLVPYKVHELISARLKIEKREQQSALLDQRTEPRRQRQGGFFARLFGRW